MGGGSSKQSAPKATGGRASQVAPKTAQPKTAQPQKVTAAERKRAAAAEAGQTPQTGQPKASAKVSKTQPTPTPAGPSKVAPAPPPSDYCWEHVRKPAQLQPSNPTLVSMSKTVKNGTGGAALGPRIVFGKHTIRFSISRMTADGVIIGVSDATAAAAKPLAKSTGPQAWGVDLGKGCLLFTENCNTYKLALKDAKNRDLTVHGQSAEVDMEIDMESQVGWG